MRSRHSAFWRISAHTQEAGRDGAQGGQRPNGNVQELAYVGCAALVLCARAACLQCVQDWWQSLAVVPHAQAQRARARSSRSQGSRVARAALALLHLCAPLPMLKHPKDASRCLACHTLQQHALCTPASAEGCSSSTPSMPGVASPCLRWRLSFATAFITVAVLASVCMLEECLVLCECEGTRGRRADDVESASSRASCEERGCTDD